MQAQAQETEAGSANSFKPEPPHYKGRDGAAWLHPENVKGAAYVALRFAGEAATVYAKRRPPTGVGPNGERGPDYESPHLRVWLETGQYGPYLKAVREGVEPVFLRQQGAPPQEGAAASAGQDLDAAVLARVEAAGMDGILTDSLLAHPDVSQESLKAAITRLWEAGKIYENRIGYVTLA